MNDVRTVTTFWGVCEHSCGMQVKAQGSDIVEIRGLKEHPYSQGYLCPKGLAAKDIYYAPDRLKHPLKKDGSSWKEISWDEANCNLLTDDESRDPVSGFPALKSQLCRVQKSKP